MKIILIDNNIKIENNDTYAVCLGIFDSVHLGHRELVKKTVELARENGIKSAVLTFVSPFEKNKIYPFEENVEILKSLGVDTVFAVNFTEKFKNYAPEYFINKYLIEYIKASFVVCGFNFRFGKDRQGNIDTLKENEGLYKLVVIPEFKIEGSTVSSTLIKELLNKGDIIKANRLLGSCYRVSGSVCEGNKLGRTISFPTINIPVDSSLSLIKSGVYSSRVQINDKIYNGISNIGVAPTVKKERGVVLETYIMDYEGDLYNKPVKVYLSGFIRDEKQFESLDELKKTIKLNLDTAKIQLEENILI